MDIDLTKIMIDTTTNAKDALGTSFVQWALTKTSASGINNSTTQELNYLALSYPGRVMNDQQKIDIIAKMQKAGIDV